jgi:hypothetical protein
MMMVAAVGTVGDRSDTSHMSGTTSADWHHHKLLLVLCDTMGSTSSILISLEPAACLTTMLHHTRPDTGCCLFVLGARGLPERKKRWILISNGPYRKLRTGSDQWGTCIDISSTNDLQSSKTIMKRWLNKMKYAMLSQSPVHPNAFGAVEVSNECASPPVFEWQPR